MKTNMKVKSLVLAMAALSVGAAQAYTDTTTNLYMTGASPSRYNVAAAIKSQCTTDGGTLTVYKNGAGATALGNQMAYVCSVAMGGTSITTVLHTTTGGSLNSVLGMSNAVAKQQVPVSLTGCTEAAAAGTDALLGFPVVIASCPLDAKAPSDGGFSDLEYGPVIEQVAGLTTAVDGFELMDVAQGYTAVAQAFGVGVSEKMYKDLQTAQGLITAGCVSGDPLPACQPSLNKADIVSLINNNGFVAQKKGAQALGLTTGASIEYARRVSTSGTQGSAQVYFLGQGCLNGPNFGQFTIVGGNTETTGTGFTLLGATKYTYSVNSGTSNVITRLTTAGNTAYAFGVVSAENRAPTTTTGWKFVKLNGVAISDGTSVGLNKQTAIDGKYDFFVETVSYKGPASKTDVDEGALIDAIGTKMGTVVADGGPTTVGLFIIPENVAGYTHAANLTEVSLHQRGGSTPNSCQPLASPF